MAVGTGINFVDLLYKPIFDRLAISAILIPVGGITQYPVRALDKSQGVALNQPGANVILETLTPVAEMIYSELTATGLTEDEVDDGTITLFEPGADTSNLANGTTWKIIAHRMNPSASGKNQGTIFFLLEGLGVND